MLACRIAVCSKAFVAIHGMNRFSAGWFPGNSHEGKRTMKCNTFVVRLTVSMLILAGMTCARAQRASDGEPRLVAPQGQSQPQGAGSLVVEETAGAAQDVARVFEYKRPLIGADISWLPSQEDRGTVFTDQTSAQDALEILAEHKFNWIRLRLFVDPTAENGYSRQGYCGLEQTLAMAKRIKAAGMKFLLDFHYSDTWADPGKQFTPAAWQGLSNDALADRIYEYTRDVVKRFMDEDAAPEMVQIGNEIHNGFVWPQGKLPGSPETFGTLLRRASEGVRNAAPNIKIMVHPALGGDNRRSVAFFDLVLSHDVVFDVIGQSYYPEHHGTLDDLRNNLTDLAKRYRRPIVVVEYKEYKKEVNEIVRDLPNGLGWGTFLWEATSHRWGGLFDQRGATNKEIDIYPAFFEDFEKSRPSQR